MNITFRSFKNSPVQNKLILLILFISGTVLILSSLLFFIYDAISFRRTLKNNLLVTANIIGNNVASALLFSDEKAASESLSSLTADEHILAAYIITPDRRIFARYISPDAKRIVLKLEHPGQPASNVIDPSTLAELFREAAASWDWDFDLDIVRDIQHNGKKVGWVVIQSDTKELTGRMLWFGVAMSAITSLMFFVVIFLSSRLQTVISRPIMLVADAMKAVSAGTADYSIRLIKESNDELGDLADGFNEMITRIQKSDDEVRMHREHLQEEVTKRTLELEHAYDQLMNELNERKRAEQALLMSESRLEEAQHIAHIGSWEWNMEDASVTWSDEAFRIFGAEPDSFKPNHQEVLKSIHPDDLLIRKNAVKEAIAKRSSYTIDYRIIRVDSTVRYIHEQAVVVINKQGEPSQLIGTMQDITEQRRLEEQLRQSQKMEAIGQLAGGIAHDFNNILTAIIGYGTLMKMKMSNDDPLVSNVDNILDASDKAATLTQSLLAFSRKQLMKLAPADLNQIIRKIEKLLIRIIGEDIELQAVLTERDLTAMVDSGQIEQILMNLVTNARDAMPDGGTLTIKTELFMVTGASFLPAPLLSTESYALISISDSGIGMDKEIQERIFEPFFTTKEMGRGTGLGLAIVYGIISQHNGRITVYSEPGEGTTFRIYLPLIEANTQEENKPEAGVAALPRGSETILVAEDDEAVRRLEDTVLREFGYTVILARNGEEAIRKFMENRDVIQLAILDMIMPKKNGKEVYDHIKGIRPDIKVLFASGYTADIIGKKGILDQEIEFVMKPLSPIALLKKVREILDK